MYVQTTILGEYYFEKHLQKHQRDQTKPHQPIAYSLYCKQLSKRPYYTIPDAQATDESGGASRVNLSVELPLDGHHIDISSSAFPIDPETFTERTSTVVRSTIIQTYWIWHTTCTFVTTLLLPASTHQLLLSVTTRGWGGEATVMLPHTIKATYKDANVTVRLHQHNITIKQPTAGMLAISVNLSIADSSQNRIKWKSPHFKDSFSTRLCVAETIDSDLIPHFRVSFNYKGLHCSI